MHEIEKIKNNLIGEFWAIKRIGAKKPFQNPMSACKTVKLYSEDIVADIGAYIGEYSLYASQFAKKINSYEGSPNTYKVLCMNKNSKINPYNKIVVGDDSKTARLYLTKCSGQGAANSIVNIKKDYIDVPAINYADAIKTATVVKIDVEGAEYDYPIINDNLRAIILEFHRVGKNYKDKANAIMNDLEKSGFKSTYKIPEFKNGWDTNSAWIR